MITALRRASGILFYVLGFLMLLALVLLAHGIGGSSVQVLLNVLDIPLLFIGCVYAGTHLLSSLSPEGCPSSALLCSILLPLATLFGFAAYLNFSFPLR